MRVLQHEMTLSLADRLIENLTWCKNKNTLENANVFLGFTVCVKLYTNYIKLVSMVNH